MRARFDRFELDTERKVLLADGNRVHLSPKTYELLRVLIENDPRALSKQELQDAIWPDVFVEPSNLASLATELRAALGDEAKDPRFIRTVHGFGYAFCGVILEPSEAKRPVACVVFRGTAIPLYEGVTTLGRDASANIVIDDVTVSRVHARITLANGNATLEDLGSKNGTFLDDVRREQPMELADGQTFVLGDARITFRFGTTAGSTVTHVPPPRDVREL